MWRRVVSLSGVHARQLRVRTLATHAHQHPQVQAHGAACTHDHSHHAHAHAHEPPPYAAAASAAATAPAAAAAAAPSAAASPSLSRPLPPVLAKGQLPPGDNPALPGWYQRPLPPNLVPFSSNRGKQLFKEAVIRGGMEGYFALAEQFQTQSTPSCQMTHSQTHTARTQ